MSAKDISKTLVLKDGVTGTLQKIIGGTVAYKKHLKDLKNVGVETWSSIKSGAGMAAVAIGAATTAMVGIGVKANMTAETAERSFGILLKSAEDAKRMVKDLQVLAETSPFDFDGMQQSAKTLLGMGFAGSQVIPMLQRLGDTVAAVGGNTDQLKGIALAIGQIQTKGKVSAEEMNQLAERGVAGWDLLSQELGKSKVELMKMAENGELFADKALPAIMNGLEKRFGGSMKSMSDTFEYTLANIKESGTRMLAGMTSPLFLALKEDLRGIQAFLSSDSAATWGASFSQGLMTAYNAAKATFGVMSDIAVFVSSNWSIIGPVVYGVAGSLVVYKIAVAGATLTTALFGAESTFATVKTGLMGTAALVTSGQIGILRAAQMGLNVVMAANPIGFVITLLGLLVTAGIYVVQNWDTVKQAAKELWNVVVDYAEQGVNNWIGLANTLLSAYDFAWKGIGFGAAQMWNGIVSAAEWGAKNMLAPINAALEAVGGQRIDVNFGAAQFDAKMPKWETKSIIPQVDFSAAKANTGFQDDLNQTRKEQREASGQRDKKLMDALNANTNALAFNTDATAGNTKATDKNTKATLRDNLSPVDLADSLLGRIERHMWST